MRHKGPARQHSAAAALIVLVAAAALGALIPTEAALGGSDHAAYVSGMHDALLAGAGLAAVGAVATAFLIRNRTAGTVPAGAVEAAAAA